jgi:hypothetical protein
MSDTKTNNITSTRSVECVGPDEIVTRLKFQKLGESKITNYD